MESQKRVSRAQSAMEYLMTYGWAILIIAVVLAALFALNVFNSGAQLGTACIGQAGYSCSQPIITQQGLLSFNLGQGIGYTTYDANFACIASSNSLSASSIIYYPFYSNGLIQTPGAAGGGLIWTSSNSLYNGQALSVQNLQCYPGIGGTTGMLSPIGNGFTGTIWMLYSVGSSPTNKVFVEIATVSAKSST